MEKILFIGGLIPSDDEIKKNTVDFMNAASDATQLKLIDGIKKNGYTPVVISAPFIGSYPRNYKKVFYRAKQYSDGYTYAMAGLPVINTQECDEYRNLVNKYRCGINCKCGDVDDVTQAIIQLAGQEDLRIKMGNSSIKMGVELFDRKIAYQKLVEITLKKWR